MRTATVEPHPRGQGAADPPRSGAWGAATAGAAVAAGAADLACAATAAESAVAALCGYMGNLVPRPAVEE
jgi:hypothetical protein